MNRQLGKPSVRPQAGQRAHLYARQAAPGRTVRRLAGSGYRGRHHKLLEARGHRSTLVSLKRDLKPSGD